MFSYDIIQIALETPHTMKADPYAKTQNLEKIFIDNNSRDLSNKPISASITSKSS